MSLFSWGENRNHELGLGDEGRSPIAAEPMLVTCLEDFNLVQVAGGNGHTLVLNRNGEVYAFGRGQEGQLGLGTRVRSQLAPAQVKSSALGDRIVSKICAGDGCSAAITSHGELFEWGFIHAPTEVGDANNPSNALPGLAREVRGMSAQLKELLRASTIQYLQGDGAHEGDHGMDQEQIDAEAGILVVRTRRKMRYTPVKSPFRHRVRDIALGYGHTLIVTEVDGTAWTKGYNDRGQLGVGTRINEVEFVPVLGGLRGRPISAIACGNSHNLAVCAETGECWAWGSNVLGQLGISEALTDQLSPARVLIQEPVSQVSAGSFHSVALTVNRTLYSFGHAEYGQHGHDAGEVGDFGAHLSRYFFIPRVVGDFHPQGVRLVSVRCGEQSTCGLDEAGALWTWGFGASGNLGHGMKATGVFAQRVEGLVGHVIVQVAAGHKHVLALTTPTGHPFALKNQPSLLSNYDCELVGANASAAGGVKCHRALMLARCPKVASYLKGDLIVLPKPVEVRVLAALVEYLYMDVVRSCPPHRLRDLQELAGTELLGLPRLVALCAMQRYQRRIRVGGYIPAEDEERDEKKVTKSNQIPTSTFAQDLLCLLASHDHADVTLAASDYDAEGKQSAQAQGDVVKAQHIPSGHTAFSWFSSPFSADTNFAGHTLFSMGAVLSPPASSSASSSVTSQAFKAHMFLLMRYPFFRILLNGHFKEEETVRAGGILKLDTVPDGVSLQGMLEWIYSGTVRGGVSGENVADLLRSSQAFGVDDLARHCELFLLETLDKDNASDVMLLAKENGLTKLARECELVMGDPSASIEVVEVRA